MINISKKFKRKLLRKFKHKSLVLTTGSSLVFGACNTEPRKQGPKIEMPQGMDKNESANVSPEARSTRLKIRNGTLIVGAGEDAQTLPLTVWNTLDKLQSITKNTNSLIDDDTKAQALKDTIIKFLIGDKKRTKKDQIAKEARETGINIKLKPDGTYSDIYQLEKSDFYNIQEFLDVVLKKAPAKIAGEILDKVVPDYEKAVEAAKEKKKTIFQGKEKFIFAGLTSFAVAIGLGVAISLFATNMWWLLLSLIPAFWGQAFLTQAKNDSYVDLDNKCKSANTKEATIKTVLESVVEKNEGYTSKNWVDDVRIQLGTKITTSETFLDRHTVST